MMLQWPQARKTGNMQRKKLDGRGIAPHSEPLTKIHALRKERDCSTLLITTSPRHFNPRAPQERDQLRRACASTSRNFNPRAPQERDIIRSNSATVPAYFNPRAPQERDSFCRSVKSFVIVFQSTRSTRARRQSSHCMRHGRAFQSTRSTRARRGFSKAYINVLEFQSTRSTRARPGDIVQVFRNREFQSTRSTRARQTHATIGVIINNFNPRAPQERDDVEQHH